MYDSCKSMSPAGVKYVNMNDSCRSQLFICMTPVGVKYVRLYDCCRSQICLQRITPAGVKYFNV